MMADIPIFIDAGTSKRLLTSGKYCDKNILVTANDSSAGGQELADSIANRTITEFSSNIESVGNFSFAYCSKLKNVNLPKVLRIGLLSFSDCSELTDANMPNLKYAENEAFNRCSKLSKAIFPNLATLRRYMFGLCSELSQTDFSSVTESGEAAFNSCIALTKLDFPILSSILQNSFYNCSNLLTVIIRTPALCTLSNANAFAETPIASGTGYIYVPKALVEEYKQATNWTTYADRIRAIEDYPEITGGAQA